MSSFVVVFVLFAFAMVGMAVGVIFSGKRGELKGSCGGPEVNSDCCQTCPEKDACDDAETVHARLGLPPARGDHPSLSQASATVASGTPVAAPSNHS